jgi:tRNA-Thr(GGU) m(6)t(6)A37 methyltransferase TsaA
MKAKKGNDRGISMNPIGYVRTAARKIPKHFSISKIEGDLVLEDRYLDGIEGIEPGDRIVVLFAFHESPPFSPEYLKQHPRGDLRRKRRGVFNLCSPLRPNPIGLSVVEVLGVSETVIRVRGIDMRDGTPILDIKPERIFEKQG